MKTIVVYKSKTGFVKKYAEWIAEALSADLSEASAVTPETLARYDAIVYGGGLYAVGINGVALIKKNLDTLAGKKIAVFATGASPARLEVLDEVRNKNFTLEQQEQIGFFYLRGGFDFNKLPIPLKLVMLLMKLFLKLKKNKTEDEAGMLEAIDNPADFTDKANIKELVAYIQAL